MNIEYFFICNKCFTYELENTYDRLWTRQNINCQMISDDILNGQASAIVTWKVNVIPYNSQDTTIKSIYGPTSKI